MTPARASKEEQQSDNERAEDILLGALGYAEEAKIVALRRTPDGFAGRGRFRDGEEFDFSSEEELTELEQWALSVLL